MIYDYVRCLRLRESGLNITEISLSMDISRATVTLILDKCGEHGITSEKAKTMKMRDIYTLIHPAEVQKETYVQPDFPCIHKELAKKGVTMQLLWKEYHDEIVSTGRKPYRYSRFCSLYREWAVQKKLIMRIIHKPAECLEIDWSGLKPKYWKPESNSTGQACVFVAVLPYSLDFFWDIFPDETIESVISGMIRAYEYFGGVTRLLKPDNMKTAVTKHKRFDIELNKSLEQLTNYYETAMVPARNYSPKDKSHAEGTVKIIEQALIAPLRNEQPMEFEELKKRMEKNAAEYRKKIINVLGCTRREYYEKEEKQYMKPLPETPYEPIYFSRVNVGNDYLADVDNNQYSVPYTCSGKSVDVLIYQEKLEFYHEHILIATHKHYHEKLRFPVIARDHMPPNHKAYLDYNKDSFLEYAEKVGPNTLNLFEMLFMGCKEPEQAYPNCASLKALGEKYGAENLENACKEARESGRTTELRLIDTYTKHPEQIPKRENGTVVYTEKQHVVEGFTRGKSQFGG